MERFSSSKNLNEANGFIQGKYIPSKENFLVGVLKTADLEFQCTLSPKFVQWLQRQNKKQVKEFLRKSQLFQVWVRQKKTANPRLIFHVISCPNVSEAEKRRFEDFFCVRGELYSWNEDEREIRIRVSRNEETPHPTANWRPFFLRLVGNLPCKKRQYERWEMQCIREGDRLLISTPVKISDSPDSKEKKSRHNPNSKPRNNTLSLPKPKPRTKKEEPLLINAR
jgi:hypothetical protein